MKIKQLSVFLENKKGRLSEVSDILGAAQIDMTAFSIADSSDFGILRAIVSDPEKALEALKAKNFAVSLTEVISLSCPDTPGALAKILTVLNKGSVQIEYMYAFSLGDSAQIIIRPASIQNCENALKNYGSELLEADIRYKI